MKLLSLNVALFEDNNSKLLKFLKQQDVDIVCLQEVTRGLEKTTDLKYLSKETADAATANLKHFFFGPASNELSRLERNVVDFILVSKGINVKTFSVLNSDVSDHLPLIMDFEFKT